MSFPTTGECHPSENRASVEMRIIGDTREDHQLYARWISCHSNWQLFRQSSCHSSCFRRVWEEFWPIHERRCCVARVHCGVVSELAALEAMNMTTKDLQRVGCPDVTNWTELAVLDTTTRDLRRVGCPDVTKWTEAVLDTTMKGLRQVGCPDRTELANAY